MLFKLWQDCPFKPGQLYQGERGGRGGVKPIDNLPIPARILTKHLNMQNQKCGWLWGGEYWQNPVPTKLVVHWKSIDLPLSVYLFLSIQRWRYAEIWEGDESVYLFLSSQRLRYAKIWEGNESIYIYFSPVKDGDM